jgi:hypothetical protein
MQYNPISKVLFTDSGTIIKKLHCPMSKQWEELSPSLELKGRLCNTCQSTIFDTSLFTDEDLINLLQSNKHACLKVNLNQSNVTITYNEGEQ